MNPWRVAGVAAGAVAAGAGAALAAERVLAGRARRAPDVQPAAPYGSLHTAGRTVTADDGLALHVEEVGDPAAPLTIVFVHGFTLSMDCWHHQRESLTDLGRLVFYDQRSHGDSARSDPDHATIDQLGRDLSAVLEATAPTGPVVLVGHSMGGMTIMALADAHPELFGSRIVGVALLSTAPGLIGETILGIPAVLGRRLQPIAPTVVRGMNRRAAFLDRTRRTGTDLEFLAIRRLTFGTEPPPSLVTFMAQMIARTPVEVITEFLPTFLDHDKLAALDVLRGVETLVVVGDKDLLTPAAHSRRIAEALPDAELVTVPATGHMVILERADVVNDALRGLVARALDRCAAG